MKIEYLHFENKRMEVHYEGYSDQFSQVQDRSKLMVTFLFKSSRRNKVYS